MNKILSAIDKYKKSLLKISENRKLWADGTKELIYKSLLDVKRSSDLDWSVQKVEGLTNLEAVNIQFNKQASGLFLSTNTGKKNCIKYGGALIFSQAYNGQVFIIYTYPHIEDWVSQMDNKLIQKVDPDEITEEFVFENVVKFLEEMTKWESTNIKTQIGFSSQS